MFEVGDHFLVLHLDHDPRRQYDAPMRHQGLIGAVEAAELAEIVGVWITVVLEENRETGEAGIDRVAARMDDARVRQG